MPWRILALILAVQTAANGGPMGLPAIAPLIRNDLHLSLTQAGSFLSAYYVGPILMSFPAGWLADRWGICRTMVAGQVLIALGLMAAAFAPSFVVMVGFTMLAGVGYGMLNPTSTKAVVAWFPQRQRATAVGMKQTGLPFGGVLGAALLPALGIAWGWRAAVISSAAGILVMSAATRLLYRDPPELLRPSAASALAMIRTVLGTADLWRVALATLIFAMLQTVWLSFLVLYLYEGVRGMLHGGLLSEAPAYDPAAKKRTFHLLQEADISHATDTCFRFPLTLPEFSAIECATVALTETSSVASPVTPFGKFYLSAAGTSPERGSLSRSPGPPSGPGAAETAHCSSTTSE